MENDKKEEVDIFRDTPVRYLGYANEVGEAFRHLIPKAMVWASYGVSSSYCLADASDKSYRVYQHDKSPEKMKHVMLTATDTLLWQSFASVIIPGFTINRICAAVQFAQKMTSICTWRNPMIPTIVGLASIPIIIHPIDSLVENVMNRTYRKWVGWYSKSKPESNGDDKK